MKQNSLLSQWTAREPSLKGSVPQRASMRSRRGDDRTSAHVGCLALLLIFIVACIVSCPELRLPCVQTLAAQQARRLRMLALSAAICNEAIAYCVQHWPAW